MGNNCDAASATLPAANRGAALKALPDRVPPGVIHTQGLNSWTVATNPLEPPRGWFGSVMRTALCQVSIRGSFAKARYAYWLDHRPSMSPWSRNCRRTCAGIQRSWVPGYRRRPHDLGLPRCLDLLAVGLWGDH